MAARLRRWHWEGGRWSAPLRARPSGTLVPPVVPVAVPAKSVADVAAEIIAETIARKHARDSKGATQ